MKWIVFFLLLTLFGCSSRIPYQDRGLDTTTNISTPTKGKAGVYVYQFKRGIVGALLDVDFEIKGHRTVSLNTGEYAYFEIQPGEYEYKIIGGALPLYTSVNFKEGENYFFRAYLSSAVDNAYLVIEQADIDEAKRNITTGRYEKNDVD